MESAERVVHFLSFVLSFFFLFIKKTALLTSTSEQSLINRERQTETEMYRNIVSYADMQDRRVGTQQ